MGIRCPVLICLAGVLFLGACESYRGLNRERMVGCIERAGITGQYRSSFSLRGGETRVLVYPGPGVTEAQAATANACIAQAIETPLNQPIDERAPAPPKRYSERQRGAATLSGGSGYRGSYLEGGTGTGLVTAAPVKRQKVKRAWRGLTPPPSGYPLLPGDEELWSSLTPAQQARALQFLEDGSTIRSSLKAD